MRAHFHVVNLDGSTTPRAVDPDHVLAIAPGRPIESRHGAPEQPTVAVLIDGSGLDSVSRLSGWVRALGDFLSGTGAAEELHRVGWQRADSLFDVRDVPQDVVDVREELSFGYDVSNAWVSTDAIQEPPTTAYGFRKTPNRLGSAVLSTVEVVEVDLPHVFKGGA